MANDFRNVESGGMPPYDGTMEARVTRLEILVEKLSDRVIFIERDVAVIRSNYATKDDLHAQTWRIIGAMAAVIAAVFWMARNVPPSPQALQAAPPTTPVPAVQPTPKPAAPATLVK